MLLIPIQALDADEFLLNTPSFTYDLRQGMAGRRNHRPEDYITKCTAVDPGEEGETVWQQALGEFFTGDQELIDYAQEICGLMAIGKVYVEAWSSPMAMDGTGSLRTGTPLPGCWEAIAAASLPMP
mgnify:CR=1 FL=1